MKTITLPGLIDPHVHFRDPGQTNKEDIYTGTSAALAGGYTTVFDMPNNMAPTTTLEKLEEKITIAKGKTVCDIGFNFGTLGDNFTEFDKVIDKVMGLKIYLNITTGGFIIDSSKLKAIYYAWPEVRPILLHSEADVLGMVLKTVKAVPKPTHICHVSSRKELEFVMHAKDAGLPITCGVTPHHLFLTDKDTERLGAYGHMKPPLMSIKDQNFMWQHLDAIDVIESDHAPHTRAEKDGPNPPFGVPGLETTLPLLLTAVEQGRLTHEALLARTHFNPARIFNVASDDTTKVVVEMKEYELSNDGLLTKCGWTPFVGRRVVGKVSSVDIRGQEVFKDGKVLAKAGSGRVLP